MKCTNLDCQKEIGDVLFCPYCGTKQEKPKLFCVYCGSEMDADAIYCNNCGKKSFLLQQKEEEERRREEVEAERLRQEAEAERNRVEAERKPQKAEAEQKRLREETERKQMMAEFKSKLSFPVEGVSFIMVPVTGGTFPMGASSETDSHALPNEGPVHMVNLSSFYIGETVVTQELWEAVMVTNPSDIIKSKKYPVHNVSWDECIVFIKRLNELLKYKLCGRQFHLPTEAQWEYAARGGNKSHGFAYAGSNNATEVACVLEPNVDPDDPSVILKPVGTKKANELGLYDMSGNIWEWCYDWADTYTSKPQTNPMGASTGDYRSYRGGCYHMGPMFSRVAYRGQALPSVPFSGIGLRLALW